MNTNGANDRPVTNDGTGTGTSTGTDSKPRTDITIILDRSGSMECRRADVIRGFNDLIAEHKALPGKARLSLVQFDHEYEPVHDSVRLADVPDLNIDTYEPRGTTALLDAVGRTITATEARLAARAKKRAKKDKSPDATRVIVVVITDGLENASTDHSLDDVRKSIARLERDAGWSFVFMGAGLEAFGQAAGMGLSAERSLRMGTSGEAVRHSFRRISGRLVVARRLVVDAPAEAVRDALEFSDDDRREAEG